MVYLKEEEVFTVAEALFSVGLLALDHSEYEHVKLAKREGNYPIAVNPNGSFWHYCSGSVLLGWSRVMPSDCECHKGKYYRTSSNMYVVIDVKDNNPFLKIVFSA